MEIGDAPSSIILHRCGVETRRQVRKAAGSEARSRPARMGKAGTIAVVPGLRNEGLDHSRKVAESTRMSKVEVETRAAPRRRVFPRFAHRIPSAG